MKKIITFTLLIFMTNVMAEESEWETAKLIRAIQSPLSQSETYATFRVPSNIPLKYWFTCNFYNKNSEVIASAHHVLRERVYSTSIILSNPKEIYFILCKIG